MSDNTTNEGIPLRDYFAGQYMAIAIAAGRSLPQYELKNMFGDRGGLTAEEIGATLAYRYADAMVDARKRTKR